MYAASLRVVFYTYPIKQQSFYSSISKTTKFNLISPSAWELKTISQNFVTNCAFI